MSILAVLTFAILCLGGPLAMWRRRGDPAWTATLFFIWTSSIYIFVVTSLAELGENMRFRYELGPLPLIGAVAVVLTFVPRWRSEREPKAVNSSDAKRDRLTRKW